MNSICRRGNNGKKSLPFFYVPTITRFRENCVPISFSFSRDLRSLFITRVYAAKCVQILYGTFAAKSPYLRYLREKVGHPVPYIVPSGTICMVIRGATGNTDRCRGSRRARLFRKPSMLVLLSFSRVTRRVRGSFAQRRKSDGGRTKIERERERAKIIHRL